MNGVNKVILIGYVGQEPNIKHINNQVVAEFSLATTSSYKDRSGEKINKTEWHHVVFWGATASVIEKYIHKGSHLYVEGSIKYEQYEKDGEKKYFTKIQGKFLNFLGSGKSNEYNNTNANKHNKSFTTNEGEDTAKEEDLPF